VEGCEVEGFKGGGGVVGKGGRGREGGLSLERHVVASSVIHTRKLIPEWKSYLWVCV